MNRAIIDALRARAPAIRERWEALLRLQHPSTPLANPDTLAFLIPSSIAQVLDTLATHQDRPPSLTVALQTPRAACTCGCNPYVGYFKAGEQALFEALVLVQSTLRTLTTRESDLAEFHVAVRTLSKNEIEAFCGVCTCRGKPEGCRFRSTNVTTNEHAAVHR